MDIRRFESKDAKKASELIHRCLREVNSKDYNEKIIENICKYYSEENLVNISEVVEFYVLKENEEVLGTACLNEKFISGIFVNPDYHKKGLGRKLVDKVENLAKERGYLRTLLHSSITAEGFYKNLGYEKIGDKIDEDFGNNIIMQKFFFNKSLL